MTQSDRYARQISVIGEVGQRRIAALEVEVIGSELAAEICALYLAGAGVARLWVDGALVDRVRAANSEVEVIARNGAKPDVSVTPEDGDPVACGARAARRVLAGALGGEA
jgi:hypothetical protein